MLTRIEPNTDRFLDWHADTSGNYLVGLSVNLSPEPYRGGVFQIRERRTRQVTCEVTRQIPGDAHLYQHRTAQEVTSFQVLPGRGAAQARKVIGVRSPGVITTDRYSSYGWMKRSRRQICWAHLRRDFQAISEREGKAGKIGVRLLTQTQAVFRIWHRFRDGRIDRGRMQTEMAKVELRIKQLLEAGSASGHRKTAKTCQKILGLWPALWTFVKVEGVEPTNNAAERALRRRVLWRRKSFGTQSEAGSEFVARILTAVISLRQQGREVMEYVRRACQAAISKTVPESLIPDSS